MTLLEKMNCQMTSQETGGPGDKNLLRLRHERAESFQSNSHRHSCHRTRAALWFYSPTRSVRDVWSVRVPKTWRRKSQSRSVGPRQTFRIPEASARESQAGR